MNPADVTLILLAAGKARRFGGDKLMAELWEAPLAGHAVAALAPLGFGERIAVVSQSRFDFAAADYRLVVNDAPGEGQARSLRLGVAAASRGRAVLIALADMPCMSTALVERIVAPAEGSRAIVAAFGEDRASPPALFGEALLPSLLGLSGDTGARDLIRRAVHVPAAPGELVDVDTPEVLAALNRQPPRSALVQRA